MTQTITHLNSSDSSFQTQLKQLLAFEESSDHEIHQRVLDIISNVRTKGDQAVLDYTNQFDQCSLKEASELELSQEQLKTAWDSLPKEKAEALKTAVIGDRRIVEYLLNKDYTRAVTACLAVKGRIVAADLEETGERRLLNLGHTVGHCIEAVSRFSIAHGAAVAMGIPVAAEMGGNHDLARELRAVAGKLGIETIIPETITVQGILTHLESDKKTTSAGRIWIIPEGWEDCRQVLLDLSTEKELLEKVWQ